MRYLNECTVRQTISESTYGPTSQAYTKFIRNYLTKQEVKLSQYWKNGIFWDFCEFSMKIKRKFRWTVEEKEEALHNVTLHSLQDFLSKTLLSKLFLEGFVHGNVAEADAVTTAIKAQVSDLSFTKNFVKFKFDVIILMKNRKSWKLDRWVISQKIES